MIHVHVPHKYKHETKFINASNYPTKQYTVTENIYKCLIYIVWYKCLPSRLLVCVVARGHHLHHSKEEKIDAYQTQTPGMPVEDYIQGEANVQSPVPPFPNLAFHPLGNS